MLHSLRSRFRRTDEDADILADNTLVLKNITDF